MVFILKEVYKTYISLKNVFTWKSYQIIGLFLSQMEARLEDPMALLLEKSNNYGFIQFSYFLSKFGVNEYIKIGKFSDLLQTGSLRHVIPFTPSLKLTGKMRLKYRWKWC